MSLREARRLAIRKSVHLALTGLLVLPLIGGLKDYEAYYATLLITASLLYSLQVKRPLALARARALLTAVLDSAMRSGHHIGEVVERVRNVVDELIREAERDYERRWGYLGVLMGATSIYLVATLFTADALVVAILSLAAYDTASAIAGSLIGKVRLPMSNASLEGGLAGFSAYLASLVLVGVEPMTAALVSASAIIAEAYGVEDNLTLPLATSIVYTASTGITPIPGQ